MGTMHTGEDPQHDDQTDLLGAETTDRSSRTARPQVGLGAAVRNPVIVILILAGIFDGLSGDRLYAVLLVGVGLALSLTEDSESSDLPGLVAGDVEGSDGGLAGARADPVGTTGRQVLLAAAVVVYAVVVGGLSRYSWATTVAVLLPGLAGVIVAWQGPIVSRSEPTPISHRGARVWGAVFVTLSLWELTNLLLQPTLEVGSYAHPTMSVAMDAILSLHVGRSISLLVWMALGWYLVRR